MRIHGVRQTDMFSYREWICNKRRTNPQEVTFKRRNFPVNGRKRLAMPGARFNPASLSGVNQDEHYESSQHDAHNQREHHVHGMRMEVGLMSGPNMMQRAHAASPINQCCRKKQHRVVQFLQLN
jgi:hypothetical protein